MPAVAQQSVSIAFEVEQFLFESHSNGSVVLKEYGVLKGCQSCHGAGSTGLSARTFASYTLQKTSQLGVTLVRVLTARIEGDDESEGVCEE